MDWYTVEGGMDWYTVEVGMDWYTVEGGMDQCCGHYRGFTINYHCHYLGIKALRLPLPLWISTKVIITIATPLLQLQLQLLITDLFLDAYQSYYTLPRCHICGDLNRVIDVIFPFPPATWLTVAQKIAPI